uniref:F-box domain-containing protein n=1 Tax=Steinernema glaseri TaxID=37863 RepID=A0A1I8AGC6_9BILA
MPTREKMEKVTKCDLIARHIALRRPSLLSQTMDSVPFAFVDFLCATLKKEDLGTLQKIGEPWTSTVATHYSRRREFDVHLVVNSEGTEVGVAVDWFLNFENVEFSSNDRIRHIWVRKPFLSRRRALPEKMPMERFRTKVLPVLNSLADAYDLDISSCHQYRLLTDTLLSGLRAPALKIRTGCFGGNCIEFIERQIRIGRLEQLQLYTTEWPDSIKVALLTFLRSPNFRKLDLEGTNLTVDLDMLTCVVERFLKRDLRKDTLLQGMPSEETKDIHRALESGDTLPLSGRLLEQAIRRASSEGIYWVKPGSESLHAWFPSPGRVKIYQRTSL